MRSWRLAGAFDPGHIRGGTPKWEQELNFHQLEFSGHAKALEIDYKLLREEFGLQSFRDGVWLAKTFVAPGNYDWDYVDRLAAISQKSIYLSLCHYEWPSWIESTDLWSGRVLEWMAEFAENVGSRYRGVFAGYIPVVESTYWTAMMSDWRRWWPSSKSKPAGSWWKVYSVVGRMAIQMAEALKRQDPETPIALSEPWAWHPTLTLDEQARPFRLMLGEPDPEAEKQSDGKPWGGHPNLLQIVGLNFYNNWGVDHGWPLSRLLLDARKRFPNQRLMMMETGNCHFSHCFSVAQWLEMIDTEVELANAQGAGVEAVTWAPVLTLGDFDWGKPAPGAWLTFDPDDPQLRRTWDPEVARIVRSYSR